MTDRIEARELRVRAIRPKTVIFMILLTVVVTVAGVLRIGVKCGLIDGMENKGIFKTTGEKVGEFMNPGKSVIDVETVNAQIRDMGELTTAELTSDGVVRYEKGKIPILTKHGFLVTYKYTVRAGIDFSGVKARMEGDKIRITIPRAQVQVMYIDQDSITIYDESHCVIKGNEKENLKECLVKAEEDAKENMDTEGLLARADERAESMVRNLVSELTGGAEMIIVRE